MAAHIPTVDGEKCTHCASGHLHAGAVHGEIGSVADVPAYIAKPAAAATHCILIVTDVFGYQLPNVQLIADKFAAAGFLCVVPDLHAGDSIHPDALKSTPPTVDLPTWFGKHGDAQTLPLLRAIVADLRAKHGVTKLAAQGYCWGARYSILLAGAEGLVDAFAAAHPSRVAVPADIEALTKPGIFLLAETDKAFTPENVAATKEILAVKPDLAIEYRHYPGTVHGFAVRGSDDDPVVADARKDALEQTAAFFHRIFA